jgi:hypothetical protein
VALLPGRASGATCDFALAGNYPVGSAPRFVALADLNGDGEADLVTANAGSHDISILLGNGDGTFDAAVNYGAGSFPHGLALADMNGDGKIDVAVANTHSSDISILLGHGNGTFASAVSYGTAAYPSAVSITDFNGDGIPDLAVANTYSNAISILIGNGNGTFAAAVIYPMGTYAAWLAAGDLSGDGKADLVVVNHEADTVSVLLGIGNGTFAGAVTYGVGNAPASAAIGDVSGDGKPDLVVANGSSELVSVLLGTGNGAFAAAVNYTAGQYPLAVVIGDVNGDGKPDVAAANVAYPAQSVSILLGNGNGTFATAANCPVLSFPESLALGDVNGDGRPDLVVINYSAYSVSILLNAYAGWTSPFTDDPLTPTTSVKAIHVAELRDAINSLRLRHLLPTFAFEDSPLPAPSPIKAIHVIELRTALGAVYDVLGLARPAYVDATILAGVTVIKRVQFRQLRSAVRTAADWRVLGVSRTGNGSGTLTSVPAGINCGTACTKSYLPTTTVTVTAAPAADSTFAGWSGACTGTGTCQVTMSADAVATATFNLKRWTLTVTKGGSGSGNVTSDPAGVSCGVDCQELYDSGTNVTLTPSAASGSAFINWTGACSGSGTCTVAMTADVSVGATFGQQATLTVTKSGAGSGAVTSNPAGIDCGPDCQETYNSGTAVTLTATAAAGSYFANWTGACSGSSTCFVPMNANVTVGARFEQRFTLTLTKAGSGTGTVNSSPAGIACGATCQALFNAGTVVTLSASAASGSYFSNWTGACSGSTTCSVTMNAASTVGATFNIAQPHTLTVTKNGTGTGTVTSSPAGISCGADCSEIYYTGTSVTLTASAAAGSYFANWGGVCSDGGTCTQTMTSDRSVTATFNTFTIDIDIARGTVRMPNKYRQGSWSLGGGSATNFVAVPPGWGVGGGSATNFVAVPPGWSVEGASQTQFIAVPPGWSVGGGSATNFVAVPPGWSVGGTSATNFVTLPPGWSAAGADATHFLAAPPGWTVGGGSPTNFVMVPPVAGWSVGGGAATNYVALGPSWTAGGGSATNFVSLPPGWTTGGGSATNFVALPPGWIVDGGSATEFVAYPSASLTTLELAFNDPGWLAWCQVLKSTGVMSDSDIADVLIYLLSGGGVFYQGMAISGWWQ